MKIKISQHNRSMPQEDGWSEMGDSLAELGDDSHTKPSGDAHAEAGGIDDPWPDAFVRADARAQADGRPEAHGETSVTPTAVMTAGLEPRPDQSTTTSDPAPADRRQLPSATNPAAGDSPVLLVRHRASARPSGPRWRSRVRRHPLVLQGRHVVRETLDNSQSAGTRRYASGSRRYFS